MSSSLNMNDASRRSVFIILLLVGAAVLIPAGIMIAQAGFTSKSLGILLAFGLPLLLVAGMLWANVFGPMRETRRLLQIGEDAQGTVLAVQQNGKTIRGGGLPSYGIDVTVEVQRQNGSTYQTIIKTHFSPLNGAPTVGSRVDLKVDPQNPQNVIFA